MLPLWGLAPRAEGASRQWVTSVIRSCSPHPCWLESTGHRPFSLGKQYMNHLNWHKLSGMLLNVAYSLFCDWGNWKRRLVLWKYYRGSICICESKLLPDRMKSTGIFEISKQFWFHGSVLGASSMLCTLSLMGQVGTVACLPTPAPCPVRPFRKGNVGLSCCLGPPLPLPTAQLRQGEILEAYIVSLLLPSL